MSERVKIKRGEIFPVYSTPTPSRSHQYMTLRSAVKLGNKLSNRLVAMTKIIITKLNNKMKTRSGFVLTGQIPTAGTIFHDISKSTRTRKRFRCTCTLFCTMSIIHVKVNHFSNLCIVTLTLDLFTSKSIGHILDSCGVCVWSFMMIGVKRK